MWRPVVDVFGPARSIFASNFPVDREAASYRTLINAQEDAFRSSGPRPERGLAEMRGAFTRFEPTAACVRVAFKRRHHGQESSIVTRCGSGIGKAIRRADRIASIS